MKKEENQKAVLGVDPGLAGALVLLKGGEIDFFEMPIKAGGKGKDIDFLGVIHVLNQIHFLAKNGVHIFLERAMALAMGPSHAFNYGRGFAALEIAIQQSGLPVTYVLPKDWVKVMHDGVNADLKPKVKSVIAVERLYPQFLARLPKNRNGKYIDGYIDALLIAGYGERKLGLTRAKTAQPEIEDFI